MHEKLENFKGQEPGENKDHLGWHSNVGLFLEFDFVEEGKQRAWHDYSFSFTFHKRPRSLRSKHDLFVLDAELTGMSKATTAGLLSQFLFHLVISRDKAVFYGGDQL